MKKDYTTYPKGYNELIKDIVPFYMRPAKDMLMKLFLMILKDG